MSEAMCEGDWGAKGPLAASLLPPVPQLHAAAPTASACGHASSSSSQEGASLPDVEDTGLAPERMHGAKPASRQASVVLAPLSALIVKQEAHQIVPQHPPHESSPPPSDSGELRVVIDSKERLRWSTQLHQRFCQAVEALGGCAVAKPKDIVLRMSVPGLTLAHVKSHLQKYRQQEGVTFVAHAPRGGSRRGHSGSPCSEWESPPKRARSGSVQYVSPPPPPPMPTYAGAPASPPFWGPGQPQQLGGPAEPIQQFLSALTGVGVQMPLPPMPAPQQPAVEAALPPLPTTAAPLLTPPSSPVPEAADKLHALADLALADHEELMAQEGGLQEAAAGVEAVGQRLQQAMDSAAAAAADPTAPQHGAATGAEALLAQQQQLAAEVKQHVAQQAALLERLAALRRATEELFAPPQAAAAPATAQQQLPLPPVAAAALRLSIEQAPAPGTPAADGMPSQHLASLVAMVAAAAAANYGGAATAGQQAALAQLAAAMPQPSVQLQQLYQLARQTV